MGSVVGEPTQVTEGDREVYFQGQDIPVPPGPSPEDWFHHLSRSHRTYEGIPSSRACLQTSSISPPLILDWGPPTVVTGYYIMSLGVSLELRSDQISRSVVSDSLRPHESQHARPPYPSPTPGVHSDSCPSSQ